MPPLLVNHSMRPIVIDNQTPSRGGMARARLPSRAPAPALARELWLPAECQISRASPERGGNRKSPFDRTFGRGAFRA